MKDEYDFSGAQRGMFFRPGAGVMLPSNGPTAFTYRCPVHGDISVSAAQAQAAVAGIGSALRQTLPCPSEDACDQQAVLQTVTQSSVPPGCGQTPLPGGGYPTMPMRPVQARAVHVVALARVIEVADAFVRAHCELEALAARIGIVAACAELESVVLGDEVAPGRRSR